jgi:hypothetical protein
MLRETAALVRLGDASAFSKERTYMNSKAQAKPSL